MEHLIELKDVYKIYHMGDEDGSRPGRREPDH